MQYEYFIPESPKEKMVTDEEEILRNIFPLKYEKIENLDDINIDRVYCLNDSESQKNTIKIISNENEESSNTILLIDDYEAVFNQLQSIQENINNKDKNNINCYSYNFTVNEFEKEEYFIPYFIKNVISENKCFCPMKNDNDEVIVKFEEPNKKGKKYKAKQKKISKQNEMKLDKIKKKENKPISKVEEKIIKKRGPYKKKVKKVEKVKTEDKCFPFNTGKGIVNIGNHSLQLNSNISSIDFSAFSEENEEKDEIDRNEDEEKNEEMTLINEQNNSIKDFGLWKFTTKQYFIALNGKKKRVKKKRKFKPDDIRKKIKARFHKIIKNIINENLKKAGSKELFDFIPQSFIGNVSKKVNFKALNLTYKEILSTDFKNELNLDSSKANPKYLRNQKVLKYLEENPDISERAGFNLIQDMKYKDLLKVYFNSAQFENSVNQLKTENESLDYIQDYIYRSKTYIRFYSNL